MDVLLGEILSLGDDSGCYEGCFSENGEQREGHDDPEEWLLVPRVVCLTRQLKHQEERHDELDQDAEVEMKQWVYDESENQQSFKAIMEDDLDLLDDL